MADNQNTIFYSIFESELGFICIIGREGCVHDLLFGDLTRDDIEGRLTTIVDRQNQISRIEWVESDWYPECRRSLVEFAKGESTSLKSISILSQAKTDFQSRVLKITQSLKYGQTLSYAQVAAKAGSPGAARAVGSVMAKNRIPLLIPCHRVVAAGGRLGGFSAPQGVDMKKRLLAMEAGEFELVSG